MLTKRIIACLDVHAGRVVKGVQFVDIVDAGDPAALAARHAREGADEIVLLDITATHEGRQTLLETVRRTARELFVPFTVGGGIRSAEEAEQVFEAGADKISVNSAALADPTLISAIGRNFGAQAVVVAIDARRDPEAERSGARCGSVCAGRAQAGRAARGGMGAGGGGAGRGRDSAYVDGCGWYARGIRLRTDGGRQRVGEHSGDCVRRGGDGGALCGCVWQGEGRCGARGEHLSLRRFQRAVAEGRTCCRRHSGEAAMLIPSIDLMGGRIVQLVQGEKLRLSFDDFEYWIEKFSRFPLVQLIDLDAAMRQGDNSALVAQIARRLPCQVGGGIRSTERASELIDAGAKRVIIGSALFSEDGKVNVNAASRSAAAVGAERVVAGIDTKNGRIAVKGWKAQVALTPDEAIPQLDKSCGRVSVHARGWRGPDAGLSDGCRRAPAQTDCAPTHRGGRHPQPAGSR